MGCGYAGIALDRLAPPANPMQGLGARVWLASPLAANLILRGVGGDGWKDFGLRPNLKSGWIWYLAALFIAPIVTLAGGYSGVTLSPSTAGILYSLLMGLVGCGLYRYRLSKSVPE